MPLEPVILAFDTSAAHCAAALLVGDEIVQSRVEEMKRGQAERLMPLLEELLAEAGLGWRDLDAVAVGIGPGNFTGIRIAVSTARGLALGLGRPAVGVDGFEAAGFGARRPVSCLIPTTRDMVYREDMTEAGVRGPVLQTRSNAEAEIADLGYPIVPMPETGATVANIARIAATRFAEALPRPAPLYIRAADAAPPKDPAPVILP
ncbi:MAG: tRNA (adenosine(37)-N6)-threonylcarbamoyltransferase complex dimerization subunit type 1 TsaB [Maritimibacter sp.]|nr:tRNA (adenosine(37)-N6)-threonylcarbamoyltransferase complex dimerization subunit type 1 TsaB [Maritimibacter sp.]